MTPIETVDQFQEILRHGPFWSGYPIYFIMSDGRAMSFAAAEYYAPLIEDSLEYDIDDGWLVIGANVNWEDSNLICAATGARIESAYGESES